MISSTLTTFVAFLLLHQSAASTLRMRAQCTTPTNLTGSPFSGRKLFVHERWKKNVLNSAASIVDPKLKADAEELADVGTFLWLNHIDDLPDLTRAVSAVSCDKILGLVLFNLPGKNKLVGPSPILESGEILVYQKDYIDIVKKTIGSYSGAAVAIVIEPFALSQIVTGDLTGSRCKLCEREWKEGIIYAVRELSTLPNVALYLDAGDGSSLGWDDNIEPGAKLLAEVFKAAGSPKQVRGFATNVANYNFWSRNPGEFESLPDYAEYNKAQDEKRFIHLLTDALEKAGVSGWHAIVDTSRNGGRSFRPDWTYTCNVVNAGFGMRPTVATGDELTDAFVWVKNGGESDGTSDVNSTYYDALCWSKRAFDPSPDAGEWNHLYFESLLQNAGPPTQ